jgi:hypothetical protein
MNDTKTIAKLLRAIAGGSDARESKHDVIFTAAADLLDRRSADVTRNEAAWVLLHRWENIAKNGGERWLREHPLVAETEKLLNEEAVSQSPAAASADEIGEQGKVVTVSTPEELAAVLAVDDDSRCQVLPDGSVVREACQCPKCGRMHRHLGNPPASLRSPAGKADQTDYWRMLESEVTRLRFENSQLANQVEGCATWQPIETAPKDGREVLLWLGAPWSKPEKARWYEPWSNWMCGAVPFDPAREEYHGIGAALPTHWMPLPSSPLPSTTRPIADASSAAAPTEGK